ncbi:class II aldolase/adducin family protein [Streptomyces sp. L7]
MLESDDQKAVEVPAALVANHGPFTWGATARKSLEHAIICEAVADIAIHTPGSLPDRPTAPPPGRTPLHPQARPRRLLRQPGQGSGLARCSYYVLRIRYLSLSGYPWPESSVQGCGVAAAALRTPNPRVQ